MLDVSSRMYRLIITERILVNFVQNKKVFYYLPIMWDKKICTERKICLLKVFLFCSGLHEILPFCSALNVPVGLESR